MMNYAAKPYWHKYCNWLTLAPLVLALLWTCVHPIVSIMTGELKCRGWFIDENALDAGSFKYEASFSLPGKNKGNRHSMCDTLNMMTSSDGGNVDCHQQYFLDEENSYLEIAKLFPIANAVTPVSESIVLMVPSAVDWKSSLFQNTLLQLFIRLSDSGKTPWLAKTILLVSPSPNKSLTTSVDAFLDAYSGRFGYSLMKSLPHSYTTSVIRNLLVLDVTVSKDQQLNELLILPQGRRGFLPNMDFLFLAVTVYSSSNFVHRGFSFGIHPYTPSSALLSNFPSISTLSPFLKQWLVELLDMFYFLKSLAVGPYPPHASSLDQGIDALTIQLRVSSRMEQTVTQEFIKRLEGIIRALSNLHERLHHSLTQYWLPSPFKFVSQSEYVIPTILALVPLVARAVALLLYEMQDILNVSAFQVVFLSFGVTALLQVTVENIVDVSKIHAIVVLVYISAAALTARLAKLQKKSLFQSLHFLTCLLAIYILVPLVIGHVSLGYPSALLWSFLVAILPRRSTYFLHKLFWPVVLLLSWPPAIVVSQAFEHYSSSVMLVHFPLHFLSYLLYVLRNS